MIIFFRQMTVYFDSKIVPSDLTIFFSELIDFFCQMAKFVLSNDKHEDHGIMKALIFVTSYFFRSSHIRRKKISSVNKLRVDQLKSKKVMQKHGQSSTRRESEESSGGVLFLLGKLKIDV